jgi:hypothetical protein
MKTAQSFHRQAKRPVAGVKKLAPQGPVPASEVRLASRFAALPLTVTPRRLVLNAAPASVTHLPNIVVVNGQQVEVVSPDDANSIDLAANMRDRKSFADDAAGGALPAQSGVTSANQTEEQVLAAIAGALTAAGVGWFVIGRRRVRISRVVNGFDCPPN